MPHNFLLIDLIRFVFPEAKIIYCKRKPKDNCFSLLTQRFVEGRHLYCYNQKTLADYYQLHENLMKVWLQKFKKEIFILDNEDLVNNQKNVTNKLLDFCGLKWEDSCMEFYNYKRQVRTASLEQVRQPINNRSIGAWKNYKPYLSDMIEILEKMTKTISIIFIFASYFLLNSCGFKPMYKFNSDDIDTRNYNLKVISETSREIQEEINKGLTFKR